MSTPWLVYRQPATPPDLRLFCFPYAGGSASAFAQWSAGMPSSVQVVAVQYPGREKRLAEEPYRDLHLLSAGAAAAIIPLLDRPYALLGHSVGAKVGFEVARRFRDQGLRSPLCFFAMGARAPHVPRREPPIHNLPSEEFRQELRRYNGTPDEVLENAELMALVEPILRADFAVNESYGCIDASPLDCPIVAIGGLSDPDVTAEDLDAWRVHTAARFALHHLPGDHFFIHSLRPAVLELVSHTLARELSASHRVG